MRAPSPFVALLAAAAFAGGATAHAAEGGLPALGPLPHTAPLAPPPDNPAALSPEQRLQRRLDALMRDRDHRIDGLLAKYGSLRPGPEPVADAKLVQPRKERDQAWDELQRALHAFNDQGVHAKRDVLDAGRPAAQVAQQAPLSALNQLRIAECFQELAGGPQASPGDLADGLAALDHLDRTQLPDNERPRSHYLRAWFLAEQARHAEGAERARLAKAAAEAVQALVQAHPESDLAATANALLIGLDAPASGKTP
jgi:hypothetical protein